MHGIPIGPQCPLHSSPTSTNSSLRATWARPDLPSSALTEDGRPDGEHSRGCGLLWCRLIHVLPTPPHHSTDNRFVPYLLNELTATVTTLPWTKKTGCYRRELGLGAARLHQACPWRPRPSPGSMSTTTSGHPTTPSAGTAIPLRRRAHQPLARSFRVDPATGSLTISRGTHRDSAPRFAIESQGPHHGRSRDSKPSRSTAIDPATAPCPLWQRPDVQGLELGRNRGFFRLAERIGIPGLRPGPRRSSISRLGIPRVPESPGRGSSASAGESSNLLGRVLFAAATGHQYFPWKRPPHDYRLDPLPRMIPSRV